MPPGPKPATAMRRASSLSKVSTPPATTAAASRPSARPTKASRPSKITRLSLPRDVLSRFPHEQNATKSTKAKSSPLSQSTTFTSDEQPVPAKVKSESEAASALKERKHETSPDRDVVSENVSEPKSGAKREPGVGVERDDKDKFKTNPRKRPKPDPSRPDGRTAAAKAMKGVLGAGATTHKLGPKANQGAINAGLRALDRTCKPCRKWEKTGFRVKSFTGRVWEIPTWRTPHTKVFGSESDQGTSSSQSKENTSSNIGSDKSPAIIPSIVASSPAPGLAINA